MSGSWTKGREQFFPCGTWSVNYEWYWQIAIWSCSDTLYFRFRAEKMFCMKIIAKFSWENSKLFWICQNFSFKEEDVHNLSSIYGWRVKWRKIINEMGGNIPGGNFLGGIFPGEVFPEGSLMGGNFPRTGYNNIYSIFFEMLGLSIITYYIKKIISCQNFPAKHQ